MSLERGLRSHDVYEALGFQTLKGFQNWLCTTEGQRLPRYRRGGKWLFYASDIQKFLRGEFKPARRQHAEILPPVHAHE